MLNNVFKAYDIRGIYPEPLNEKNAWQIGFGCAQFLLAEALKAGRTDEGARTIVVGRDMRKSSPSLVSSLKEGISAGGAAAVDVGMVDTPFTYFAANHLNSAGAVQTTASHNPAHYNGFKVSGAGARPIGQDSGLAVIKSFAEAAEPREFLGGVAAEYRDLWAEYRAHLLKFLPKEVLDGTRTLHVVIDASNGMAGTMIPKVFGGIDGLRITEINFDNSSGEFVHEPNPLVEANLTLTRDGVRALGADFGVCFDGDADRCMVIDERGEPVGCDLLTAWLAQGWLRSNPGASIVYDLRSTRSVAEAIREAGGIPIEGRVGHVFMKQKLRETHAPFGGELSGHFYYGDMWCTDSGARAFANVITMLVAAGKPMSECIKPFRRYCQSGEINFENDNKQRAIETLRAKYPHAQFHSLDGLSMDCGDWWANIRMSNTEPLLRLNLEARHATVVATKVSELESLLGHRVQH